MIKKFWIKKKTVNIQMKKKNKIKIAIKISWDDFFLINHSILFEFRLAQATKTCVQCQWHITHYDRTYEISNSPICNCMWNMCFKRWFSKNILLRIGGELSSDSPIHFSISILSLYFRQCECIPSPTQTHIVFQTQT